MKSVILWGPVLLYDQYKKYFETEILKGHIKIIAIVLNKECKYNRLDGIDVVSVEAFTQLKFDYIVDMNQDACHNLVERVLQLLNIDKGRVIPVRIFMTPYFDFKLWEEVKNRRISIFANQCWGGYASHLLGLQFLSPCVNMWFGESNFFRMLMDLKKYMEYEPRLIREEYDPVLNRLYPVVGIGDIEIHMNHYADFETAVYLWNERKKRINYQDIFVHAILYTEQDICDFMKLPYGNKHGFTMLKCNNEQITSIEGQCRKRVIEQYNGNIGNFLNHMAMNHSDELKRFDILKMMNGDMDFKRYTN